jgi:uncharacterized membrane protein YeaQ/YmgE (transglycosylase-associated protein family)
MSATIINLIIQLIAGAVGGNAVGAASKDISLGTLGNTIAGAVGGVGGGQLLSALIPMLAGAGNNVDIFGPRESVVRYSKTDLPASAMG